MTVTQTVAQTVTQTIVCGTDFSSSASAALHVAARLAQRLGDKLVLVSSSAAGTDGAVVREALAREAAAVATWAPGAHVEVLEGEPGRALSHAVERHKARLLVLGSASEPGRTGRVAERASAVSGVPTLLVRSSAPFQGWLDGKKPLRVILAASHDHSHASARELVALLRQVAPCDVVAVHASFPPDERRRLRTHESHSMVDHDAPTEAALLQELRNSIGELPGSGELRFTVRPTLERFEDAIVDAASAEGADLVVVGSHRRQGLDRLWHGSVAAGVLRHARSSVVVAPYQVADEPLPLVTQVLVPVDGEKSSAHAIALASSLVGQGGTVHLVHLSAAHPEAHSAARLAVVDAIRATVPRSAAAHGAHLAIHVLHAAHVADGITAAATRLGCDLICMRAAHARNSAAPLLLGSVVQDVLARANRPIVIVRDPT